jgi:hypothetical protein
MVRERCEILDILNVNVEYSKAVIETITPYSLIIPKAI